MAFTTRCTTGICCDPNNYTILALYLHGIKLMISEESLPGLLSFVMARLPRFVKWILRMRHLKTLQNINQVMTRNSVVEAAPTVDLSSKSRI